MSWFKITANGSGLADVPAFAPVYLVSYLNDDEVTNVE
jgi:hypothetical protein